jgi:hypothetical protein
MLEPESSQVKVYLNLCNLLFDDFTKMLLQFLITLGDIDND